MTVESVCDVGLHGDGPTEDAEVLGASGRAGLEDVSTRGK